MIRIKMQNKYYQPCRLMLYFYNNESFLLVFIQSNFYYGNLLPLCVSLKTIDSFRSFALPTKRSQTEGQNIIQTIISRYKRFLIYHIRRYIYI